MTSKKVLAVVALSVIVAIGAYYYLKGPSDLPENANFEFPTENITLSLALPDYGKSAVDRAISLYSKKHPNVTISANFLPKDNYHTLLKSQLNFGRPPDIFVYKNDYVNQLSASLTTVSSTVFPESSLNHDYLPGLTDALKVGEAIKGIPITGGTYALLVNNKILNAASVEAPTTWTELLENAPKLIKKEKGVVTQGAVALGGYSTVAHAADIVALLMLQNGSLIVSADHKRALFNEPETSSYYPGTEALKFYIAFANPNKDIHSFDENRGRSVNEFIAGKVAMIIGDSDDVSLIKSTAPTLDFSTERVPQVEDASALTVFSFWSLGTSAVTGNELVAQDFIKFLTNKKNQQNYTAEAVQPSSRGDVSVGQAGDKVLKGFIDSLEIAQFFYKKDPDNFEAIMRRAIRRVYEGENPQKVVDEAATELTKSL